jgi:hypothetical protein
VLFYLPFFNPLSSAPPPSMAFISSFPKQPNPCSPSPSQTQKLLGFNPS